MNDADLARRAAEAGAAVVRATDWAGIAREEKGGGDFATAADLAAERAVLDLLRAARPGDAFTGEESGRSGDRSAARQWLVDPLCGTLNFAVGTHLVGVNVALREHGRTVAAATADPYTGETYWTDGAAAHLRRNGLDTPLAPTARSRLVDLNLDPPYPNAPGLRVARLLTDPDFEQEFRPRVVSTTLAVAWVAAGRRAAYLTDGHLADSVHFAAGIALCEAAGCTVTDLRGAPVHTGAGGLIAAADPETHARLLGLLARQQGTHVRR
ncbi:MULTISPECIES: inositol monophosphatase family protein [Kitasatospora]|uniref:Putative inositol monophosphatase n=1 Tax=Kitasatospora setae (strain ATCC 33774 / DSM 43861 / JCM 3304 / KCC A-0304 / NBRC 14216 / KM-6054) TaxID=452652 RepID=E4NJ42_KITSK|nr:inositol monophosphatase family protein [Kitasatospora setae]BAJ32990.1 putative inositol monophosphatase [Kitasatospora setae KM-6054]